MTIGNLPVLQQMTVGMLTEKGVVVMNAPVFRQESTSSVLSFIKGRSVHPRIEELATLSKRLKELDLTKGVRALRIFQEKTTTLKSIVAVLKAEDKQERSFIYGSDTALMDA